jgi:hypothetical protein
MTNPEFGDLSLDYEVTGVTRCAGIIRWLVQGQLCLWPRIREGVCCLLGLFTVLHSCPQIDLQCYSAVCMSVVVHRPIQQSHVYGI